MPPPGGYRRTAHRPLLITTAESTGEVVMKESIWIRTGKLFRSVIPARPRSLAGVACAALTFAAAGVGLGAYFQSFETDTFDWVGAVRVPTTTHGVPSKVGAFHAEDQNMNGLTYTFWGGESKTFPPGGYTTTVDIYLDTMAPYMNGTGYNNDTRFDWDSAIGTPQCGHRRDFVFNAGYYTDVQPLVPGNQPGFIISASNNA